MKAMNIKLAMIGFVVSLLSMSCERSSTHDSSIKDLPNTLILEWNEIAFTAFDGPVYQHSLMASRINAMVHIAMHDALNAIHPVYKTYKFNGTDEKADPIAAAASAAHAVLMNQLPAKKNFLDSALNKTLSTVADSDAKTRGIALGQQAAMAIIEARSNDGSAGEVMAPVPPSDIAGVYTAVPPFDIVFAPNWENVKLFALERKDQFRVAPLPALNSPVYTADFNEVKEYGRKISSVRTPDQTNYSKFWYEFSEAGWNRVARVAILSKRLNLYDAARVLALVDMAMADAYIAGWDSKFHYNFWRPFTAIRKAAIDGNDATSPDLTWEPAEATPPIHDYPSTHSALGNAGATVLAKILGDNTPFTMTSFTASPAGSTRTFNSFSEAAKENADSRVRAGIHFRFSCIAGLDMGGKIGNWVVEHYLQPVK
jgi:hypothetical protein